MVQIKIVENCRQSHHRNKELQFCNKVCVQPRPQTTSCNCTEVEIGVCPYKNAAIYIASTNF